MALERGYQCKRTPASTEQLLGASYDVVKEKLIRISKEKKIEAEVLL